MERNQESSLKKIVKATGEGLAGITAISVGVMGCTAAMYNLSHLDTAVYSIEPALLSNLWFGVGTLAFYDSIKKFKDALYK